MVIKDGEWYTDSGGEATQEEPQEKSEDDDFGETVGNGLSIVIMRALSTQAKVKDDEEQNKVSSILDAW